MAVPAGRARVGFEVENKRLLGRESGRWWIRKQRGRRSGGGGRIGAVYYCKLKATG